MERTIIKNEYDGPRKPKKAPAIHQFALDFAYSRDAKTVDAGIRETIKGVKLSIMVMGIALCRVDNDGLFIDLGFKKFGEYIDHLSEETGMSRTTFYNWEYIGQAYLDNRAELEKIGFSEDDGPTKLSFLGRALEHYQKKEVFKNLVNMSYREFEGWSRGPVKAIKNNYTNVKLSGNKVLVDSEPIAAFADGLAPEDRRYYEKWLFAAAQARENNEYLRGYIFYDEREANVFDKIYKRELKNIRSKK
jgi:hypothetical protein